VKVVRQVPVPVAERFMMDQVKIEDTFAEAFPMCGTRLIITAADCELADIAAGEFCGNASSVIGCDAEAGIEGTVASADTHAERVSLDKTRSPCEPRPTDKPMKKNIVSTINIINVPNTHPDLFFMSVFPLLTEV